MKHVVLVFIVLSLVSCAVQQEKPSNKPSKIYKNVKITEGSAWLTGNCEPSIAINPKNPKQIIAGNVLDEVHVSNDGGYTWGHSKLTADLGVYGDPCVIADDEGRFYYLHLANPDGQAYGSPKFLNHIVLQSSFDGGKSWSSGTGIGKNEPKQQDKEWAVIHPDTGQLYVCWTEFDKYGSKDPKHHSRILFSTSIDYGQSFSTPIKISHTEGDALDDDMTTEGAVPAVSKDGKVYVAWSYDAKIYFNRSLDNGITWETTDRLIAQQPGGWAQDIPGIMRCNGMPVSVVDNSDSPYSGTIYINWTDQRNGSDNTDVFLIKSTDNGLTWSKPIRVNQDKTKTHQFFTWMDVDPVTGYIYIVFYDRSLYANQLTDVALAVSKDGGASFEQMTISESPFEPVKTVFFGDYNNIDVYNGVVRPIWTRYQRGKLSVWTALIKN